MLTPLEDDDPVAIGPYRLVNRIGEGGMGTVYLAFTETRQPVAVKIASAELSEDVEFRRRFQREVRAAQRVRGAAVAAVLDADTVSERPWMVTEYVEGVSLADAVRQRGPLPERLVRGLAAGLADALVAIHQAKVVHRDLKPSNILLAWDGPKVIDFGIAQLDGNATLTRKGHAVGTLAWMAPEQMRGEPAGPAADIFSWACCVAYAATGRHPFHADRAEALAFRIQRDAPDSKFLPAYLHETVLPALSKDPQLRPPAAALLERLSGYPVRSMTEAHRATETVLERDWALPGGRRQPPPGDDIYGGLPLPRDRPPGVPAPGAAPRSGVRPSRAAEPRVTGGLRRDAPPPGPGTGPVEIAPPGEQWRPVGGHRRDMRTGPPSGGLPVPGVPQATDAPRRDAVPTGPPSGGHRLPGAPRPTDAHRRDAFAPPTGGQPPAAPPGTGPLPWTGAQPVVRPGEPATGGHRLGEVPVPTGPPSGGPPRVGGVSQPTGGHRLEDLPAGGPPWGDLAPPGGAFRADAPPALGAPARPGPQPMPGYQPTEGNPRVGPYPDDRARRPDGRGAAGSGAWPAERGRAVPPPYEAQVPGPSDRSEGQRLWDPASRDEAPRPSRPWDDAAEDPPGGGRDASRAPGGHPRAEAGPARRPGWNTTAVLAGLLGVLWLFGAGSALAVYLGYRGRAAAREGRRRGDAFAAVGIVLGWPGIAIGLILIGFLSRT